MKTLSLELSKRLHELGVVMESEHDWTKYGGDWQVLPSKGFVKMEKFPAPTFTELWGMMPEIIEGPPDIYLELHKLMGGSCDIGYHDEGWAVKVFPHHESPAEAAGMLLIWLAENGHVKGEG